MKKIFVILSLFCLVFSCDKKETEPKTDLNSAWEIKVDNQREYLSLDDELFINAWQPEKVIENLSEKINSQKAELNDYLTYVAALTSQWVDKEITNKDLEESLKILDEQLLKYPNNSELYRLRWLAYDLKWETEEAKKSYEKALELNQNDSYIFSNLWALYRKTWDLEKAKDFIEKSLKLDEKNHQALMSSAIINLWEKKYDEAIKSLDKILENYVNNEILINANTLKAKIYEEQEKYNEADKSFLAAIGLWEKAETYLEYWIYSYNVFLKKLEENKKKNSKNEEENNSEINTTFIGENYLSYAKDLLQKSLELNPNSVYTNLFLWFVNQDTWYISQETSYYEEAEKYYKKASELLEKDESITNEKKEEIKKDIEENLNSLTL